MTDPGLRASDADRQRVVTALERHAVAGRIDLDEYAVRVDRALVARTHGELAVVTADLPVEGPTPDRPTPDHLTPDGPAPDGPAPDERRHLLVAFALAALVVAALAVVLAVAR